MSRIGKKEIILPAGVEFEVSEDNVVTVKGPKGILTQKVDKSIIITQKDNIVNLSRKSELAQVRSKHGLYRSLVANMVEGVSKGFSKSLIIKGVGYKAQMQGNKLVLNLGFSHLVEILEEDGIKIECPTVTEIKILGIDKQKVGQVAAKIRSIRPVEPYHGYGVRYSNEQVITKVGKTAGKGKK